MLRITSSFGSSCFGGCTGACCFLLFFCFLEPPKSLLRLLRRLFLPPRLSFRLFSLLSRLCSRLMSWRFSLPFLVSFALIGVSPIEGLFLLSFPLRLLLRLSPRLSLRPPRLSFRLLFLPPPRLSFRLSLRLLRPPRLSFRLLFLPSPRFSLRPLRLSLLRLLFLPSPRLSLRLLFLSPRLSFLLPRLSLLRLSLLPRLLPDSFFWNFAFNLSTCSSDTVLI